tara:strand:+ start:376 stop:750 length:375 start_codon:yes stop_codon:yes gene_type:complete
MGRYYSGDIEGKFWFGVQSSNDGEFFGMEQGEQQSVSYYIDESDIDLVEQGIKKCKKSLHGYLTKMDKFYNGKNENSEKSLAKILNVDNEDVHLLLVWYARLELGKKIYECVLEQDSCYIDAEL